MQIPAVASRRRRKHESWEGGYDDVEAANTSGLELAAEVSRVKDGATYAGELVSLGSTKGSMT